MSVMKNCEYDANEQSFYPSFGILQRQAAHRHKSIYLT